MDETVDILNLDLSTLYVMYFCWIILADYANQSGLAWLELAAFGQ